MSRKPAGQIVEHRGKRGITFSLRFRAYGRREFSPDAYVDAAARRRMPVFTYGARVLVSSPLADTAEPPWATSQAPAPLGCRPTTGGC